MSEQIEIPPIEKSLLDQDSGLEPLSVEQRYYTRFYTRPEPKVDKDSSKEAGLILVHSNRICLVCLSPHHAIHQKGLKVERLNFQVTNRINR